VVEEVSEVAVTGEMVKKLREVTGAGVLDCRNTLQVCAGDFDRAVEVLREKGLAAAEKKVTRVANQGIVGSYIHTGSKAAALVEVNCETDFVARNEGFQELAHDLAMQVVAMKPRWVRPEDIPAEMVEVEREQFRASAVTDGKSERVVEQIVEGRMGKFYSQFCLMRQAFIRDEDLTIEDVVKAKIAQFGENIVIKRFARMEVGES
jgi:elongation factor Ts